MSRFPLYCLVWTAACLLTGIAGAQPSKTAPDALILVQPGEGRAVLSVTFPAPVSHPSVRGRVERLARAAGWKIASLEVKDQDVKTSPQYGASRPLGKQTGALALLTNAPQMRQGGFHLQPYVDAFSDLQRLDLLFLVPAIRTFEGLREFESPALSVKLIQEGGPYRYQIAIRDHTGALPALPLKQPPPPPPPAAQQSRSAEQTDGSPLALAVAIAAASGLSVLILWLLLARLRVQQSPRVDSRRAERL